MAAALFLLTGSALHAQTDERVLLAACLGEPGSGDTHASGIVTNSITGSPLAGARVEAVSPGGAVFAEAHSRIGGAYRLCNMRSAMGLALRVVFGANESPPVVITDPGPRIMNLTVRVSSPVTIMGTVLNGTTRQPLEGVWMTLSGTRFSTVTNREGKFSFLDVPPGSHVIESNLLGYAFRADSLTLLNHALGLRIALSEEAIALDPVTVTAVAAPNRNAEIQRIGNLFSSRFQGVTPSEMDRIRHRVLDIFDVIRHANIPGIRISPMQRPKPGGGFLDVGERCVEHARSVRRRLDAQFANACHFVAVFLDDAPIADPELFLNGAMPANEISHIQFMPAFEAMARYGRMAENGALLIYTRGR